MPLDLSTAAVRRHSQASHDPSMTEALKLSSEFDTSTSYKSIKTDAINAATHGGFAAL